MVAAGRKVARGGAKSGGEDGHVHVPLCSFA